MTGLPEFAPTGEFEGEPIFKDLPDFPFSIEMYLETFVIPAGSTPDWQAARKRLQNQWKAGANPSGFETCADAAAALETCFADPAAHGMVCHLVGGKTVYVAAGLDLSDTIFPLLRWADERHVLAKAGFINLTEDLGPAN